MTARRFGALLALPLLAVLSLSACNQNADARSGAGAAANGSAAGRFTADEYVLGDAKAKVTVTEYLSNACTHCARFDKEVFPAIRKEYVDTGKVKWVVREFLTGPPEMAAAGFVLARCAGRDKYWPVTEAIFNSQDEVFKTGDIRGVFLRIAHSMGMTDAQFDACLRDEKAYVDLNARVDRFAKEDKVNSTPLFIINGKRYEKGEMTVAEMKTALADAGAR